MSQEQEIKQPQTIEEIVPQVPIDLTSQSDRQAQRRRRSGGQNIKES